MNLQDAYNITRYTCRGCTLPFEWIYRNEIIAGRVPHILHCNHTLCAECIKSKLQDERVICPTCGDGTIIPKCRNKNLQDHCPYNIFVFGLMYCKHRVSKNESPFYQPSRTRQQTSRCSQIAAVGYAKEECSQQDCNATGTMRCAECIETYCDKCCETVHKIARGFCSHKISPVILAAIGEVREVCPFHPQEVKEFHCVMCDKDACGYSMLEVHSGHQYSRLKELSEADKEQFRELIEAVQLVLRQFRTTETIVASNQITHNACSTEVKIARYCADLHGRLQLAERKLVNHMRVAKHFDFSKLSSISNEVGAAISTLTTCIDTAKSLLTSDDHKVNVQSLKEQLTNCLKIPCHLVGQAQTSNVIKCVDNWENNVEQLFSVEADTENEYRLVTQSELPDNYKPCELPEEVESVCAVVPVASRVRDTRTVPVDGSARVTPPEFSIGSWIASVSRNVSASNSSGKDVVAAYETVEVWHINTPETFYVQFLKCKACVTKMTDDISSYVKNLATVVHDPPQLNAIYAVKYKIEPSTSYQWCRGQVTDIAMDKNGKELVYQVFYLDFGNTQRVRQHMLRHIPAELANIEPFAVHCKIYDINPRKENKWERGAISLMTQILNGSDSVALYPYSVANEVIEVDLTAFSNESDPSSVRDALLFTGFGVSHMKSESQVQRARCETAKLFKNDHRLKTNQEFVVSVSHVCSPELLYVQIVEHLPQLDTLMKQMQKFYTTNKKGFVYNPKQEMNVVVLVEDLLYPTKDNWYRAEIVDIVEGKGAIKVFLVDYGATVNVLWTNVRKLQLQFTNIECQAIGVKFADVEAFDEDKGWPQSVVVKLKNYMFSKEKLRMVVSGEGKPLKVVLFEVYEAADLCVNAQLVDNQQAKSTGTLSKQLNWPKQVKQADDLEKSLRSVTRIEVDDVLCSQRAQPRTRPPPLREVRTVCSCRATRSASPICTRFRCPLPR